VLNWKRAEHGAHISPGLVHAKQPADWITCCPAPEGCPQGAAHDQEQLSIHVTAIDTTSACKNVMHREVLGVQEIWLAPPARRRPRNRTRPEGSNGGGGHGGEQPAQSCC
jgi:hypothetical protein